MHRSPNYHTQIIPAAVARLRFLLDQGTSPDVALRSTAFRFGVRLADLHAAARR